MGRRPATPYLHTCEMVQAHAHAGWMQPDAIRHLEAAPARFVVFVNMGISWQAAPDADGRLLAWYRSRVPERYAQVGRVNLLDGARTENVWGDAASAAPRSPQGWISVWQRRDAADGS